MRVVVLCDVCRRPPAAHTAGEAAECERLSAFTCRRCEDTGELDCPECDGQGDCDQCPCGTEHSCGQCMGGGYFACADCDKGVLVEQDAPGSKAPNWAGPAK